MYQIYTDTYKIRRVYGPQFIDTLRAINFKKFVGIYNKQ